MRYLSGLLSLLCASCVIAAEPASNQALLPPASRPATQVTTLDETWHDAARQWDVPVRLYQPAGEGPWPVIIFSHGLGGSRRGYSYLGQHWAARGYFCVFPQHVGSDESLITMNDLAESPAKLRKATTDPDNLRNRPKDISFVIDELERRDREGILKGQLDLKRIGVAGHSFGAYTTLAIAGQRFGPTDTSFADPRVACAIAMSEQPPAARAEARLAHIAIPMLHMTGTRDTSRVNDTRPEERRSVFDAVTPHADHYLIIIHDAVHLTFGGVGPATRAPRQALNPMHEVILATTTRFWDAYLRGQGVAELRQQGFTPLVRPADITEKKLAKANR